MNDRILDVMLPSDAGTANPFQWAKGKGKRKRKRRRGARDKVTEQKETASKPQAKKRPRRSAATRKHKPKQLSSNWLERWINSFFARVDDLGYGWRDYFRLSLLAGGLLIVLYYAFSAGGYFVVRRGYGELAILYFVVLGLLFGLRVEGRMPRLGKLELGFFGAYSLWVLLSVTWSYIPAASMDEFIRACLYLGGYLLFYLYLERREWLAWMGHLFVLIAVIVAVDSLFGKIGIIDHPDPFQTNRLSYPVTYWNTMGLMMIMAFPIGLRVLADRSTNVIVRCFYAPALILFITVLFFTFSRAGLLLLTLISGLYLLVAVQRLRAVLQGTIAAAWTLIIVAFCYLYLPTMVKLIPNPDEGEGQLFGVLLLIVLLLSIAPQIVIWFQEKRVRLGEETARKLGLALAGLAVLLFLSGAVVFFAQKGNPVTWLRNQIEVISEPEAVVEGAEERLLSLQSERYKEYAVSLGVLADNPIKGTGAGTWSVHWYRERPREIQVKDGHSWLFETVAEMGLAGTILVLGFVVAFFSRCVSDLRFFGKSRHREIYGAFFAACTAFLIHAMIDWDWEMAVITLTFFMFAGGLLRYGAISRADAMAPDSDEQEPPGEAPHMESRGWSPRRLLSWNWLIGVLCVVIMVVTVFPLIARTRIESATKLASKGQDYVAAGNQAELAHRLNPLDAEALILMAASAQNRGDIDEAERLVLEAIDLEPYSDKYYRNLTRIYITKANAAQDPERQQEYTEKAVEAIKKSRELNPLESKDTGPLEIEVRKLGGVL